MKFKVARSALLDGLQAVQNVVGTRSTLPILSNVLLHADKKTLWLTTTDLDVTVRCAVEADVAKSGSSTLPVRRLSSIVRELPESSIEIDIDDKDVATVQCDASLFKLHGLSHDEFPPTPKTEGKVSYTIEQNVFREMLNMSQYAASSDETRQVLNGVYLNFSDGKLTMVATDGRRLALVEHEVEFPADAGAEMILPTKAVNELHHTLGDDGDLKIYAKEKQALFEFGNVSVSSKLIDGKYPNYRQVIPAQCETRVTIERESLLTALKRVSLLAADSTSATKLTFEDNRVTIVMNTPDVGEAKETVPLKYDGKALNIAFNPDFMIEPLRNISDDEVFLELTDEMSPGVLKCSIPFLYVLMPVRVT
jgi:DNA polymerase-3 subunit beta